MWISWNECRKIERLRPRTPLTEYVCQKQTSLGRCQEANSDAGHIEQVRLLLSRSRSSDIDTAACFHLVA